MSSLRNAVKRITHKERSQPRHRAHLGILEKKPDYRVRAQDYHKKQDTKRALKRKAAARNPDEFYFGMHRAQVRDGQHQMTQEAKFEMFKDTLGVDAVRIMKDQDLRYVRLQKQKDMKKVEKIQASLHFLGGEGAERGDAGATAKSEKHKRKHTIFLQDQEEADRFDVSAHFQTVPELAGRAFNRPRIKTLKKLGEQVNRRIDDDDYEYHPRRLTPKQLRKQEKIAKDLVEKTAKARAAAYKELEARNKRISELESAEAHLVTEKLVQSKGRKRKIKEAEDGKPAVYKWDRKRAR